MTAPIRTFGFAAALSLGTAALADPIEFRCGVDVFSDRSTILDGFQYISAMREVGNNLHFGQTLYSAAIGNAGGLYVGGFELQKRWALGPNTELELGGFIGGGGGAALVKGDGLMTRVHLGVKQRISEQFAATVGLAYVDISGSPVSSPALSLGVSRDVDFAFSKGFNGNANGGRILVAVKPLVKQYRPRGSIQRSGTPLKTMSLVGFEASFANSRESNWQTFLQSSGAVAGDGEGFADIQGGIRYSTRPQGFRAFGEAAIGFAGGGDVDTGGGLIASLGAGIAVPIWRGFELEAGTQVTRAFSGDFEAVAPFLRASLQFGGKSKKSYGDTRNWQLSLGATRQQSGTGYRNPGVTTTASPVLTESSIDLFLTDRSYMTGNAQTVVAGEAGGYAVGLIGLGYQMPIGQRWSMAFEGHSVRLAVAAWTRMEGWSDCSKWRRIIG